jgi:HEAT repeat protein
LWDLILSVDPWYYAIGFGVLAAVIVLWDLPSGPRRTNAFVQKIYALAEGEETDKNLDETYLLGKTTLLEELEVKHPGLIEKSGVLPLWAARFKRKPNSSDLNRLMHKGADRFLYDCFLGVLEHKNLYKTFSNLLENAGLEALARQCDGLDFDGAKAATLLSDRFNRLRELAGDPLWQARFFALHILLSTSDPGSDRVIQEAYTDPHPLVRRRVVESYNGLPREELYQHFLGVMLNDAAYEVRAAAAKRIFGEFTDLYSLKMEDLGTPAVFHAMEFFRPGNDHDINIAMKYLEDKNLELRLPAARFLDKGGILSRMIGEVRFEDAEILKRNSSLLAKALEVNVHNFLLGEIKSSASLFLALELLETQGPRDIIPSLAAKAMGMDKEGELLWKRAVQTICFRGTAEGLSLLYDLLVKESLLESKVVYILENLPSVEEQNHANQLLSLLTKASFSQEKLLLDLMAKSSPSFFLPKLIDILQIGRQSYSHTVRVRALKGVALYKLPYTIQMILEQLPTLPLDQARDFVEILTKFGGDFEKRVGALLEQPDGKIRSAIIASLPKDSRGKFMRQIKAAIDDPEPQVRVAAVWAFLQGEDTKRWAMAQNLLRDPVASVREAAAAALGTFGTKKTLDSLLEVFEDPNEVYGVRAAVLRGLAASSQKVAMEYLTDIYVNGSQEFTNYTSMLIQEKRDTLSLQFILEIFKDSSPKAKERIVDLFVNLGSSGEAQIRALLEEDIPSLKPYLSEILERTGYVESMIRRLGHRKPVERVDAAKFLAELGTEAAFRGIVLAARDPNETVRIQVTKAVEKLSSPSGKAILKSLEQDPDAKVRKYTHWALERIKGKETKSK